MPFAARNHEERIGQTCATRTGIFVRTWCPRALGEDGQHCVRRQVLAREQMRQLGTLGSTSGETAWSRWILRHRMVTEVRKQQSPPPSARAHLVMLTGHSDSRPADIESDPRRGFRHGADQPFTRQGGLRDMRAVAVRVQTGTSDLGWSRRTARPPVGSAPRYPPCASSGPGANAPRDPLFRTTSSRIADQWRPHDSVQATARNRDLADIPMAWSIGGIVTSNLAWIQHCW